MIDVINMDKVLRSVYLDVVSSSLNEKTSAFYKKVVKSGANVYGKDIIAPCRIGINGGVACTEETGNLPATSAPTLLNFKAPLVNIYGNLEISDKLLRVNDGAGGVRCLDGADFAFCVGKDALAPSERSRHGASSWRVRVADIDHGQCTSSSLD